MEMISPLASSKLVQHFVMGAVSPFPSPPAWLWLLVISHMAPLLPIQHRPWHVQGEGMYLKAQSTGGDGDLVQSSSSQQRNAV